MKGTYKDLLKDFCDTSCAQDQCPLNPVKYINLYQTFSLACSSFHETSTDGTEVEKFIGQMIMFMTAYQFLVFIPSLVHFSALFVLRFIRLNKYPDHPT
jgi:hypothetical protein